MRFKNFLAIAVLFLALAAIPAYASLVPTTFGFPVIVQNGSTSAFNQDTANATDFEALNVNFPPSFDGVDLGGTAVSGGVSVPGVLSAGGSATFGALPFGPVDLGFPDVSQVVDQTQAVTHTDFSQTNEYAEFAYPFVAAGPASLPGFGFGF